MMPSLRWPQIYRKVEKSGTSQDLCSNVLQPDRSYGVELGNGAEKDLILWGLIITRFQLIFIDLIIMNVSAK